MAGVLDWSAAHNIDIVQKLIEDDEKDVVYRSRTMGCHRVFEFACQFVSAVALASVCLSAC